jgi:hypothetical protein
MLVRDTDKLDWFVEAAHPALSTEALDVAVTALERVSLGEWRYDAIGQAHFALEGRSDDDRARETLVPLLLFADAVAADRSDLGNLIEHLAELAKPDEQAEEPADADEAEPEEPAKASASTDEHEDVSGSGSPFESIGAGESATELTEPVFAISVRDDHVELGMGLTTQLDSATFERLVEAWSRSLRGRYDVRVEVLAPDAEWQVDLSGALARIVLSVRPDALTGHATVADIAPGLHDHIDTLEKVCRAGIDPLVFLGVHDRAEASRSQSSQRPHSQRPDPLGTATPPTDEAGPANPLESIGSDEQSLDDQFGFPTDDSGDSDDRDNGSFLFIADEPEGDPGGLLLDLSAPPADGDPLIQGRYEDSRLNVPDAMTSLVDVVLRHPGYSDRRIGQVLSILLSVDYADALDLANSAPRVIVWGVGEERAQTMKTVIEGAGGKVVLVEPDTFPPR